MDGSDTTVAVAPAGAPAAADATHTRHIPSDAAKWLKRYGYFLKFESNVFGGIFLVAYTLKWGVAWHDAGV